MPVAESGEETYGAENQDVKTDPVSFYQGPLFSVIFLACCGLQFSDFFKTIFSGCYSFFMVSVDTLQLVVSLWCDRNTLKYMQPKA